MLNRIKIFPVARRNYCHKIKPQVYVHVFTSISLLQNSLSNTTSLTALEILQLLLHFPRLSMTLAVFHDFPGLENGLTKFHDFPWVSRKSGHPVSQCYVYHVYTWQNLVKISTNMSVLHNVSRCVFINSNAVNNNQRYEVNGHDMEKISFNTTRKKWTDHTKCKSLKPLGSKNYYKCS